MAALSGAALCTMRVGAAPARAGSVTLARRRSANDPGGTTHLATTPLESTQRLARAGALGLREVLQQDLSPMNLLEQLGHLRHSFRQSTISALPIRRRERRPARNATLPPFVGAGHFTKGRTEVKPPSTAST
jgi:hypothetical protein